MGHFREVSDSMGEVCIPAGVYYGAQTQRAVEKHVSEIFARLGLASDETISRRVHATLLFLSQRGT